MSREVYELSAETGLLGLPERVQISNEDKGYSYGWDVEYLDERRNRAGRLCVPE